MARHRDDRYSLENMATEGELFGFYAEPKDRKFNPFNKPEVDRYQEFKNVCSDLKRIISNEKKEK